MADIVLVKRSNNANSSVPHSGQESKNPKVRNFSKFKERSVSVPLSLVERDNFDILKEIENAHSNLLTVLLTYIPKGSENNNKIGNRTGIKILNEEFIKVLRDQSKYKELSEDNLRLIYPITTLILLENDTSEKDSSKLFEFIYNELISCKNSINGNYTFNKSPRLILRKSASRLLGELKSKKGDPDHQKRYEQIKKLIRSNLRIIDMNRNELVIRNKPFIFDQAMNFVNKDPSPFNQVDDLVQEGNIGLLNSIDRFDLRKGYTLLTFAGLAIRRQMFGCSGNDFVQEDAVYRRKYYKLTEEYGRHPSFEEVARAIGKSVRIETVRLHLMANYFLFKNPTSLDTGNTHGNDDADSLYEILDSGVPIPEKIYAKKEIKDLFRKAVIDYMLDPCDGGANPRDTDKAFRNIDIILRRFGLGKAGYIETQEEIAEGYVTTRRGVAGHITRERIRQIEEEKIPGILKKIK